MTRTCPPFVKIANARAWHHLKPEKKKACIRNPWKFHLTEFKDRQPPESMCYEIQFASRKKVTLPELNFMKGDKT